MEAKNNKTIEDAFKRLRSSKGRRINDGLISMLDDAVKYALELHEQRYLPNHLEQGDSYGWAFGYGGVLIDMKVNVGPNDADPKRVSDTLESIIKRHTTDRYVGVVMAGMEHHSYYVDEWEISILEDTMDMLAGDFEKYFHEIED